MMKPVYYAILALTLGVSISSNVFASASLSKMYTTCKEQARVVYGSAEQAPHVSLVNVKRHQKNKRLRLRVVPPGGGAFTTYCDVNRQTGELVSLEMAQAN